MKFVECPQGTPEWFAARCGKITASEFVTACSLIGGLTEQQEKYVTAVRAGWSPRDAAVAAGYKVLPSSDIVRRALAGERTEDWSDTARRYAADLSIERISAQPHGEPPKAWVLERGHTMEEAARRIYEGRTGAFVTEAGICLTDDGIFGYSTDGLVDDDGLIEIKAPIDSTKILAMWQAGDTSEYDHQMQGGLWITGRKWCDFIMYVPDLAAVGKDLYVKRVFRDDAFIDAMVQRLNEFDKLVAENEAVWRFGYVAPGPDDEQIVDAAFEPEPAVATMQETPEDDPDFLEVATTAPAEVERTPIGQVLHDGLERYRAAKAAEQATVPSLRLGQICERLGFTLTEGFLNSIGFAPAGRDKAARLYHDADFPAICAALTRHISAVQAKQAA